MKLKEEKIKKFFTLLTIFTLLVMVGYQLFSSLFFLNLSVRKEEKSAITKTEVEKSENQNLPEKIDLPVPFTPQAPYAIWDSLHNNACEEAALIMVNYFLNGKKLNKQIAEKEIQDLVAWQIKNWGKHKDLTLEELKELAEKYYHWQKIRILDKITIEKIKKELSNGNPIIVPVAGRLLNNPYYRRPGPYYHMLVIRGYSKDKIITNDPGTKRGEKFSYPSEIIYQAIHDWPGKGKDILEGEKRGLIIEK